MLVHTVPPISSLIQYLGCFAFRTNARCHPGGCPGTSTIITSSTANGGLGFSFNAGPLLCSSTPHELHNGNPHPPQILPILHTISTNARDALLMSADVIVSSSVNSDLLSSPSNLWIQSCSHTFVADSDCAGVYGPLGTIISPGNVSIDPSGDD